MPEDVQVVEALRDYSRSNDLIGVGAQAHGTFAKTIESYCLLVIGQAPVSFGSTRMEPAEVAINAALKKARENAEKYMNELRVESLSVLNSVQRYIAAHEDLAALVSSDDKATKLSQVDTLVSQCSDWQRHAKDVSEKLGRLAIDFSQDAQALQEGIAIMHRLAEGDTGILAQFERDLKEVQGKIDKAIFDISVGGLAVIGGIILIGVAALSTAVTGPAAWTLGVGGVLLVGGGAYGVSTGGMALHAGLKLKGEILQKQAAAKQEIATAKAMEVQLGSIVEQAKIASYGADNMATAWKALEADMKALKQDVEEGKNYEDALTFLYIVGDSWVNLKKRFVQARRVLTTSNVVVDKTPAERYEELQAEADHLAAQSALALTPCSPAGCPPATSPTSRVTLI
ncbi:HBL/NHE enterotoxin family protein [Streptomyces sp. NPDC096198]|uniref:HBL/NHE enterotoxin family protein n=1 Tax=Streptomyces sp. NPDC096198 TaxID=3366080 RepID=UPI00381D595F